MVEQLAKLKTYPGSVRSALMFLVAGWLLHFAAYFGFLLKGETQRNMILMVAIGVGICYFVATIKNWARMLCIFFNIGIAGIYVLFSFSFFYTGETGKGLLTVATIIVFVLSTYYLLVKETTRFFKTDRNAASDGGKDN